MFPVISYIIGFSIGVSYFLNKYKNDSAYYIQVENEVSSGLAVKILNKGLYFKHRKIHWLDFYDRGYNAGNNSEALKIIKQSETLHSK